jgi:hypothetical protein
MESDSSSLSKPKRCASDRKNNGIESVENYYRKSKLLPEFGVKYDHMFAFGNRPQQFSLMGMVISDALVYKK